MAPQRGNNAAPLPVDRHVGLWDLVITLKENKPEEALIKVLKLFTDQTVFQNSPLLLRSQLIKNGFNEKLINTAYSIFILYRKVKTRLETPLENSSIQTEQVENILEALASLSYLRKFNLPIPNISPNCVLLIKQVTSLIKKIDLSLYDENDNFGQFIKDIRSGIATLEIDSKINDDDSSIDIIQTALKNKFLLIHVFPAIDEALSINNSSDNTDIPEQSFTADMEIEAIYLIGKISAYIETIKDVSEEQLITKLSSELEKDIDASKKIENITKFLKEKEFENSQTKIDIDKIISSNSIKEDVNNKNPLINERLEVSSAHSKLKEYKSQLVNSINDNTFLKSTVSEITNKHGKDGFFSSVIKQLNNFLKFLNSLNPLSEQVSSQENDFEINISKNVEKKFSNLVDSLEIRRHTGSHHSATSTISGVSHTPPAVAALPAGHQDAAYTTFAPSNPK